MRTLLRSITEAFRRRPSPALAPTTFDFTVDVDEVVADLDDGIVGWA